MAASSLTSVPQAGPCSTDPSLARPVAMPARRQGSLWRPPCSEARSSRSPGLAPDHAPSQTRPCSQLDTSACSGRPLNRQPPPSCPPPHSARPTARSQALQARNLARFGRPGRPLARLPLPRPFVPCPSARHCRQPACCRRPGRPSTRVTPGRPLSLILLACCRSSLSSSPWPQARSLRSPRPALGPPTLRSPDPAPCPLDTKARSGGLNVRKPARLGRPGRPLTTLPLELAAAVSSTPPLAAVGP
jgi:hypothetical protein